METTILVFPPTNMSLQKDTDSLQASTLSCTESEERTDSPLITLLQFNIFLFWNKLSKESKNLDLIIFSQAGFPPDPHQHFQQSYTTKEKNMQAMKTLQNSLIPFKHLLYILLKNTMNTNENNGLFGFFKGFIQLHISGEKIVSSVHTCIFLRELHYISFLKNETLFCHFLEEKKKNIFLKDS